MKKILLSAAALLSVAGVQAADLRVAPAPQARAVETYNNYWDGLYVGINGGFGTGKISAMDFSSDSASGFLGGIQAGANKQLGNIVIGLVTDFDGGTIDKSGNKLGWLGTTRAKLGFLVTPTLLIYGTGGAAYGGVDLGTIQNGNLLLNANGFKTPTVGWTVGAGAEFAITPNVGLGAEYLHVKLDGPSDGAFNTSAEGDIFRGLLNFKF